jgi:hypothetical protein
MFDKDPRNDGIALLTYGVFGICVLVLIAVCPVAIYLFYSEDSKVVDYFVDIVHIILPIQVSEAFELGIVLIFVQIIVCVYCASLAPPVMQVLEYVGMLTYWMSSLRQLW